MKKILMLLFVVCAAMSVRAQGYVGGAVGFWHGEMEDLDVTTFAITPEIGYNFNEKLAIGAELGYAYIRAEDDKLNVFNINPYARYTYCETGIVRLFLDGGFGVASVKIDGGDSTTGFEIGLKPGVAIKLNDTFSLIAKVGFFGYRDDYAIDGNTSSTQEFGFNLSGTDLKFGFQVNF